MTPRKLWWSHCGRTFYKVVYPTSIHILICKRSKKWSSGESQNSKLIPTAKTRSNFFQLVYQSLPIITCLKATRQLRYAGQYWQTFIHFLSWIPISQYVEKVQFSNLMQKNRVIYRKAAGNTIFSILITLANSVYALWISYSFN